jgi:hypothetical protein
MSIAHTTTAPALGARRSDDRRAPLRRIGAGLLIAAALAVLAIALWPASEADKARADGEQLGRAVSSLTEAQTPAEVDAAVADVHRAVQDTRDHAGDAVAEQVDDQAGALDRAVDGFVGMHASGDEFEADLYQAELQDAVDDLTVQAEDFRAQGTEVQQAYWDGYTSTVNAD